MGPVGTSICKSLDGYSYVAAHINNTTCETMLYFQEKKSETYESYKQDEAYIENKTGCCIEILCSD